MNTYHDLEDMQYHEQAREDYIAELTAEHVDLYAGIEDQLETIEAQYPEATTLDLIAASQNADQHVDGTNWLDRYAASIESILAARGINY
jgi:hypothetical protein